MAATLNEIRQWVYAGKANGATHVLVMCDTFERDTGDCCYPVEIMDGDPQKHVNESGDALQECYSMSLDLDEQLRQHRVYNFD